MSSVNENQILDAFEETSGHINELLSELVEIKYRMEKLHFDLLMAIEPKLTAEAEQKWDINCQNGCL